MLYQLIIVGGGPGGIAAGIYAARKKLNTLLIADSFGGQSLVSAEVQNWIGVRSISGFELGKTLESHLRAYPETKILEGEKVQAVERLQEGKFSLLSDKGKTFEAETVLVVSGSRRKRLNIPGEHEFEGKGVVYCSICDAPLFEGKEVVVVGGGNAGLEAVLDLIPYAKRITLLHRGESLKGDPLTQEKISRVGKVNIILRAIPKEIKGSGMVEVLYYEDVQSGEIKNIPTNGVFVEIGSTPNSDFVKNMLMLNERGEIIVDHKTQETSQKGIWAAGDVSDARYKQNNISVGDSIKAVLNIYEYFSRK